MEIIGLYISEKKPGRKESSSFWHRVFIELEKRGLKDILILCADGLKGLEDAARAVYPDMQFQSCMVHLVRASARLVAWKQRAAVCAALKKIYDAPSYEVAEIALEKLVIFQDHDPRNHRPVAEKPSNDCKPMDVL